MRQELQSLGLVGRSWILGITIFSLARALVVWPSLAKFGVSPGWFLAIDLVTAPPYGIGQAITVKILRSPNRDVTAVTPWVAVVIAAFMAPYVFILVVAGEMPASAYLGLAAWMIVFGGLACLRIVRKVRLEIEVG